jgi:hypothetical protein
MAIQIIKRKWSLARINIQNKYLHSKMLPQVSAKSSGSPFWKGIRASPLAPLKAPQTPFGGADAENFAQSRPPCGFSIRRDACFHPAHPIQTCPGGVIRLKRIYNFLCSMLVFTPFAQCLITLCGTFMHFPELTY